MCRPRPSSRWSWPIRRPHGPAARRNACEFSEWIRKQGEATRLNPATLVWCVVKPGRDLREEVEQWLAWKRVKKDVDERRAGRGVRAIRPGRPANQCRAPRCDEARDEVWNSYRYIVIADNAEADGIRVIDIGAGHASSGETLCGRAIAALKSLALLNESPGAGYLERRWPPAFKDTGAWPLVSLRQAFLTGGLGAPARPGRLPDRQDPRVCRARRLRPRLRRAARWQPTSTCGSTSSCRPARSCSRKDVFLLQKAKAEALKKQETVPPPTPPVKPPPEGKKTGTTGGAEPRQGDDKGQPPEPEPPDRHSPGHAHPPPLRRHPAGGVEPVRDEGDPEDAVGHGAHGEGGARGHGQPGRRAGAHGRAAADTGGVGVEWECGERNDMTATVRDPKCRIPVHAV